MTADTVRARWINTREQATRAAEATKQSQGAIFALFEHYRGLDQEDRRIVDGVISEQVLSDDESIRFDAVALVEQFRIICAMSALRELMGRLEQDDSPGAPYEWAKVNRVIANLADAAP